MEVLRITAMRFEIKLFISIRTKEHWDETFYYNGFHEVM